MGDYQTYLNPSLLELLVEDLLDTLLITYLNALANSPKLRMPAAADRVRDDTTEIRAFFVTLKPAKEIDDTLEVLEMILALLEASKDIVFLSYWSFAKVHGPNLAFVEGLMKARGDFDRATVSDVMDSIKRKVKDENIQDPPEPTIMKKVAVQNMFTRFLRT